MTKNWFKLLVFVSLIQGFITIAVSAKPSPDYFVEKQIADFSKPVYLAGFPEQALHLYHIGSSSGQTEFDLSDINSIDEFFDRGITCIN